MGQINEYLLQVKSHLHLDDPVERDIVSELYAHLSEKAREIHLSGKSMEHSYDLAVRSMGRPRAIAGLLYEAHIVGRARDAFLTGLPYAIVSLLFATHLWRDPTIATVAFTAIVSIMDVTFLIDIFSFEIKMIIFIIIFGLLGYELLNLFGRTSIDINDLLATLLFGLISGLIYSAILNKYSDAKDTN